MSGCGCTGHYHNGGCPDQNVVYWLGLDGKLPKIGIPVHPTPDEVVAQDEIVKRRLNLPRDGVHILTPEELRR